MVDTIAPTIASSFRVVGVVENLVSMVAENFNPGGAGPVRSVNTPTICGRRLGSAKPPRLRLARGIGQPDEGGESSGAR